jgi:glycosyltransferase involved in cell wall biosynthesis/GT2 family glycosyltransferase
MKIGIVGIEQEEVALAASLAEQGHQVFVADRDLLRVRLLQEGQFPLVEPGLAGRVRHELEQGALCITHDLAEAIAGASCCIAGSEGKWIDPREERIAEILCRWRPEVAPPAPPAPPTRSWMGKLMTRLPGKHQASRMARLSRQAAQIWRQGGVRQVLARGTRKLGRKLFRTASTCARVILNASPLPPSSPPVFPALETFIENYARWMQRNDPTEAELAKQFAQARRLRYQPTISLVTPVYNPPPEVLEETIRSVQAQTYPHWELCLADGKSPNPRIQDLLSEYARRDPRIKVTLMPENRGIVANSNEALTLATGAFVGLLDHDDLLAPQALFEVVRYLNEHPETDMLYSDEDKVDEDGRRFEPFFKPEWSPELLDAFMYVGHLTVYRRALLSEVGGIPTGCDFSQDYDLALRITEKTRAIAHLPKVLYHWKAITGSAAAGGKPYARESNLRALAQAVQRRGHEAEVREYPCANRVQYRITQLGLVSIVIPSDNEGHIRQCVQAVLQKTTYPNFEILVVTNSKLIAKLRGWAAGRPSVELVAYDQPFNFSAKCNLGAERARGRWVLFLNDDVEPLSEGWLEAMVELCQRPQIGAVSPKLLYANGTIQHAGMVTGVRGFVGTAFHCEPADTTRHINFAQSTRNTSALSAACLLMPRRLFQEIGGFDAVNTPIMHSDVDLCFKIREAGHQLVYTPFSTLKHIGHASLGGDDDPVGKADPAELYLLKRWGGYTADDPYFPPNMRDYLYRDSPVPFRLAARNASGLDKTRGNLMFFTHDLSFSGAPLDLFWLARWLWDAGFYIVVYSPETGPLLECYRECGIPVIVDPAIREHAHVLKNFLANFDLFVVNTILGSKLVHLARQLGKPSLWLVHEGIYGQQLAAASSEIRSALGQSQAVVFPAHATAARYRAFGTDRNRRVIPYGLPDVAAETEAILPPAGEKKLRLLHLGTVEPRKGQEILLEAMFLLPPEVARRLEVHFVGRIASTAAIPAAAQGLFAHGRVGDNFYYHGEHPPEKAKRYLKSVDILVSTSRDEALPISILEAMAFSKAVIATPAGGVPEMIEPDVNGMLVPMDDARALADALAQIVADPERVRAFGTAGRRMFEMRFMMDRYGRDIAAVLEEFLPQKKGMPVAAVQGERRKRSA